jgi:Flp pilus assembly pilin Flp
MRKRLRKLLKNEQGQALAEYHVLIPGSIVMIMLAYLLTPGLLDAYRHIVYLVEGPKECVVFNGLEDNSYCDQNENCAKIESEDMNHGTFRYADAISVDTVVIKAGKTYSIQRDNPYAMSYTTSDGCYQVTFKTNWVEWERLGEGKGCQEISHIDVWQAPICQ